MRVYTSYFAASRNFNKNAVVLGITRFPPNWWNGLNIDKWAPSEKLLRQYRNKEIDEFIFSMEYVQELQDRGFTQKKVKEILETIGGDRDIILCCYEKPGDFCHRHVFANWMADVMKIEEYGDGE